MSLLVSLSHSCPVLNVDAKLHVLFVIFHHAVCMCVCAQLNSDSEDESAAMTQNRPTLNGNVVVNGSTTGNSVVNGITMGYSVVNGSTMDNLVVNISTTGNLVVNGVTTPGASNIQ